LLQTRKLDENKIAEALATIERNAKLQAQLIDDLLDIARILRGKLTLNPDPVNLTFVIEAAIELFQPDILVSDIGMPQVDGYTLLRQVRSLPPERGGEIPAIALTAYAGEMNKQQALAAGFQSHLSKPIDPNLLTETVTKLIRR
jgi:CheY-like chemotaxis protein